MVSRFLQSKKVIQVTILLGSILVVPMSFYGALQICSPQMCSLCHMMKPEYYTWQESAHSNFGCIDCHVEPGSLNLIKSSATGAVKVFKAATGTYVSPIIKLKPLSDRACERCHDLSKRAVSTPENIVVPHDKHKKEGVPCYKCHSGVAHGNISKRGVTFQTDYAKWEATLADSLMDNSKFRRPNMEACMNCHKIRKATLKCEDCHDIRPIDHRTKEFINEEHGSMAFNDLKYCDSCHHYTISPENNVFKETPAYIEFLETTKPKKQSASVSQYAKYNTYCRACHKKRPAGHGESFNSQHGSFASKSKDGCLVCHDNELRDDSVSQIVCGSCHPSIHETSIQWKWGGYHPTELGPNPKLTEDCYGCHSRSGCGRCHG